MGLHMFSFGETPFDVSLEGKLDKSGSFDVHKKGMRAASEARTCFCAQPYPAS